MWALAGASVCVSAFFILTCETVWLCVYACATQYYIIIVVIVDVVKEMSNKEISLYEHAHILVHTIANLRVCANI